MHIRDIAENTSYLAGGVYGMVEGLVHDRREGLLFGRWLTGIDEAGKSAA